MRKPSVLLVGLFVVLLGAGLSGCATSPKRGGGAAAGGREAENLGPVQRGMASWYGKRFKGRPTASGELFNPEDRTAAHKTLSFGTVAQVRNLRNNRTILVRINDRGPFVAGRIIDLSERAARELGMLVDGVVPVEVRVVRSR